MNVTIEKTFKCFVRIATTLFCRRFGQICTIGAEAWTCPQLTTDFRAQRVTLGLTSAVNVRQVHVRGLIIYLLAISRFSTTTRPIGGCISCETNATLIWHIRVSL
jgi:hypothetical protein